uniref:Uncharacterized protein n=1 Tax=Romanomermis culicivorax TaxID=13658 RepID=A0A915IAV6_ROMCU
MPQESVNHRKPDLPINGNDVDRIDAQSHLFAPLTFGRRRHEKADQRRKRGQQRRAYQCDHDDSGSYAGVKSAGHVAADHHRFHFKTDHRPLTVIGEAFEVYVPRTLQSNISSFNYHQQPHAKEQTVKMEAITDLKIRRGDKF